MKPPQFDGKSSWVNYLRQFEAAAKANGWSLAEKATALTRFLSKNEDYHQLVRHLEMQYGQSHLEHVYHSQLKNRCQKNNESLQQFEADIARLVRLAYSSTPENVMGTTSNGLLDSETRQALILARPSKLVDALARALEFEAAKQSSRGQAKVRKMEENVEEGTYNEAEIRRVVEDVYGCIRGAREPLVDQILLDQRQELHRPTGDYVLQPEIPATIRDETNVTIVIGNVSFEHRALVAEIEDEHILGMDVMNAKGFELDFKDSVLQINGEEKCITRKTEETVRVVLAEDTAVPERSEMILDAQLDGDLCDRNIMVFEPRSHDGEVARRIPVEKALLLTEKTVPVRKMNLNHHPKRECFRVLFFGFLRKLDVQEKPDRKIQASDQTTELNNLITKYADIFDNGQGGKGTTNVIQHKIDTGDARPIRQTARLPLAKREETNKINPEGQVDRCQVDKNLISTQKMFCAGKVHRNADALSRRPCLENVLSDGLLKRVLETSDGTEERKQLLILRNRVSEVLEAIHNESTGDT
ncbi:hypothetical protein NQ318_005973 [Aromia moschata]|uniref:Retrotransposon gag domain-containing protein n=1 Tax=Aromia moschata TaxID=1265417 RepID=A0AAV8XZZ2_9CUCU|nr:hypothetical protein NQ318_005973 [Aromia moschata]